MSNNNNAITNMNHHLFELFRLCSLEVMRVEGKNPELAAKRANSLQQKNLLEFYEEITCIMLIGEEIKIVLKAHFWLEDAIKLLSKAHPGHSHFVRDKKARDFMKEICNITAGRIKYKLLNAKCNIGQSLPVRLDGFNQMFFAEGRQSEAFDIWKILQADIDVTFSASIQVYQDSITAKITPDALNVPMPPEVELF